MADSQKPIYHLPQGAVWFITGCSSGIGLALAKYLSTYTSNRIVATARNSASLSSLPSNDKIIKLPVDVTSIPSIDISIKATLEHFGRIDVLVNNAGYTLLGDTEAAGDEESRKLMDTNFWGMVDVTKRVLGVMRDENVKNGGQRGGVVMNVSSMGGWFGFPACSFYHASKFAMEGWTEAVSKELPAEWNIHLTLLEPGGVKTNFVSSLKTMETRHSAYDNPNYPTNALFAYMKDPTHQAQWAEPSAVAEAMYRIVSRREKIPIRVPIGKDAWEMIMADVENCKKEFEDIKELSLSVAR